MIAATAAAAEADAAVVHMLHMKYAAAVAHAVDK